MKRTTHTVSKFLCGDDSVQSALVAHITANEMRKRRNETQAQCRFEAGLYPAKVLDFDVDDGRLCVRYIQKNSRKRNPFQEDYPLAESRQEVVEAVNEWLEDHPSGDLLDLAKIGVIFWNVVYLFRHLTHRVDAVDKFIKTGNITDDIPLRQSAELRPAVHTTQEEPSEPESPRPYVAQASVFDSENDLSEDDLSDIDDEPIEMEKAVVESVPVHEDGF